VNMAWKKEYFRIAVAYIFIIILIPIIIIFICNSLIIYETKKADSKREKLHADLSRIETQTCASTTKREAIHLTPVPTQNSNLLSVRSRISNLSCGSSQSNTGKKQIIKNSNKITKMLVLISFSFCLFNLPYFITW